MRVRATYRIDNPMFNSGQTGVNTLLDVARQTYKETNMDAVDLIAQLSGRLPNLTLNRTLTSI